MRTKLSHIQQEIISQFQIERDQATIQLLILKERFEQQQKLVLFNELVDFNAPLVLPSIIPFIVRIEAIDFLLKNHNQLKRKMSITELVSYSEMYNITTIAFSKIGSLSELKTKFKNIKPANNYIQV